MRRAPLTIPGCFAACVLLAGCLDGGGGTPGEAGVGGFHYECVAWGDPVCDGQQPTGLFDPLYDEASRQPIPNRIAVGAAFGVRFYDDAGGSTLRRPVDAASALFVDELPDEDAFVAVRAGTVAMLAQNGAGAVVDLVHVRIEEPAIVQIDAADVDLRVGDSVSLTTRVFTEDRAQLGGALPHTWTVRGDGDGLLGHPYDTTEDALADDHVTFEALAEGNVEVTVEIGDGIVDTITLRITGPAE